MFKDKRFIIVDILYVVRFVNKNMFKPKINVTNIPTLTTS